MVFVVGSRHANLPPPSGSSTSVAATKLPPTKTIPENVITLALRIVNPDEVSQLLALISNEYQLGNQTKKEFQDLHAYVPFLRSRDPGVREVAALAVTYQQNASLLYVSHEVKNALESLVGFEKLVVRAGNTRSDNDPRFQIKAALADAMEKDVLRAYTSADFWPTAKLAFYTTHNDSMADDIFSRQAAANSTELMLALMRMVLWNRAEALAQNSAKTGNSRGGDIEVTCFYDKRDWGKVKLSNRSNRDLHHLTLSLRADKASAKRVRELEILLGAATAPAVGKETEEIAEAFGNFMKSVDSWYAKDELPARALIHLGVLPAGEKCEVRLFASSLEFNKTRTASYSVWADGVILEQQHMPEYDEAINARLKENAALQKAAEEKRRVGGTADGRKPFDPQARKTRAR